jgi:hypothetical protein
MRIFSSTLQALYATKPLRQALLSLKFHDLRLADGTLTSMENYWQGNSPAGLVSFSEEFWHTNRLTATEDQREAIECGCLLMQLLFHHGEKRHFTDLRSLLPCLSIKGTIRLLTLFVFLTYTKRPICLAEDVISHPPKSNYAYVMNSSRRPASDVASCECRAPFTLFSFLPATAHRAIRLQVMYRQR